LGQIFGLVAAAALLIDYVMTVAVSTASAVAQVYSVVPALYDLRIEIAIASIALITVANLRGLREAGLLFASPTYICRPRLMIGIGPPARSPVARPVPTPPEAILGMTAGLRSSSSSSGRSRGLRRAHRGRGDRERRAGVWAGGGTPPTR
jgi:hypothetical protein